MSTTIDSAGRAPGRVAAIAMRITASVGGVLAVAGVAAIMADGYGDALVSELSWVFALFAVFFAAVVRLVGPGQPDNAVVWTMAASAFFCGLWIAGLAGAALVVDDPSLVLVGGDSVVPTVLPPAAAWIMMFTYPALLLGLFLPLTFGLLLFPDGKLPSPRWRWLGWLAGVNIVVLTVGFAWGFRPTSTEPAGSTILVDNGFAVVALVIMMCLVALAVRYRRSSGPTRQQFKWVVWGASVFVPTQVAAFTAGGTQYEELVYVPFVVGTLAFLMSYAIAVGKYRLFDIDVVINKTVMVAALGVAIAAIYVAVVVGTGSLLGSGDAARVEVQLVATAVVAIAFGPVRRRAQIWANRAVYGERATPYEVLARFSHRAAEASGDELLTRIPRLIVDGTGAVEATLWLKSTDSYRPAAAWPGDANRAEIPATEAFEDPQADYSVPVFHDGELLGGISLVKSRGEQLPPAAEQLVANLASGMGLALRNATLTAQLQERVSELEASRERILLAADEARRALERDLDSGPQQQLVALKVMLGPTRKQAGQDGATKTAELLAQLETDTGEAIHAVRDFSGGVYPPLLEAEGLAIAITQQAQKSPLAITVDADRLGRHPREVEAAVYFTILEALQNIAKYARASDVSVVLRQAAGELSFEVADDGAGFDPDTVKAGSGFANMADRLDAAGGSWHLESAPGSGTRVRGTVPIGAGAVD